MSDGKEQKDLAAQKLYMKHWKFKPSQQQRPTITNPDPPGPAANQPNAQKQDPANEQSAQNPMTKYVHHWKFSPIQAPPAPGKSGQQAQSAQSPPVSNAGARGGPLQFHAYNPPGAYKQRGPKLMRSTSPLPMAHHPMPRSASPYGRHPHSVGHTPPQPSYLSTSPSDGLLHLLSAAKLLEEGETKTAAAEQHQYQYSGDETESDTDAKGDRALPVPASAPFAIPKPRHS
jgi:hypothetical protein